NFRLARIAFGPFPFSHQLKGKSVPVDMTFRVTSCTGVTIPEPRTPNTISRFQNLYSQAKPITKPEQLVKTCKARADDHCVKLDLLICCSGRGTRHCGILSLCRSTRQSEGYCIVGSKSRLKPRRTHAYLHAA